MPKENEKPLFECIGHDGETHSFRTYGFVIDIPARELFEPSGPLRILPVLDYWAENFPPENNEDAADWLAAGAYLIHLSYNAGLI